MALEGIFLKFNYRQYIKASELDVLFLSIVKQLMELITPAPG